MVPVPLGFFDNWQRYFSTILCLEPKPKLKHETEICKQVSFGILHISELQLVNDFKNKRRHLILFYYFYFTVIDCRSEKIFSSPKIYNVKGFFRQWNLCHFFFLRTPVARTTRSPPPSLEAATNYTLPPRNKQKKKSVACREQMYEF